MSIWFRSLEWSYHPLSVIPRRPRSYALKERSCAMQQLCTHCGAPIQPGSASCFRCGATVASDGAGANDPTIRASAPPGANYGPPPMMAPVVVAQKKRRLPPGVVVVVVVLVLTGLGGILSARSLFFQQQVRTGAHITRVQTGTGFDDQAGKVTGETSTFHQGATVWVVYTVTNADADALVTLKLYNDGAYELQTHSALIHHRTNFYGNRFAINRTGEHQVELYYNDDLEASITFNVT